MAGKDKVSRENDEAEQLNKCFDIVTCQILTAKQKKEIVSRRSSYVN